MKKILLGLVLTIMSSMSFAGDKGNGGGVHLCPNKINMYDVFEAENRYGWDLYRGGVTTDLLIGMIFQETFSSKVSSTKGCPHLISRPSICTKLYIN